MANRRATSPKIRACRECGAEFARQPGTIGAPHVYCSKECGRASANRKIRERTGLSPKCRIEGCENPRRSRIAEWCEGHYARNRRHGSPYITLVRKPNLKCYHCAEPVARRVLFCSDLCRRRDRMNAPCLRLACLVCDVVLPEDAQLGSKFCSQECKRTDERARKYGINPRELRARLATGAGCEICGTVTDDLVVDHCHESYRVRGMLCTQCNVGIGMFSEDPARMQAAANYLLRLRVAA